VGRRECDIGTNSVMGFSLPMEPNGLRNANLAKVKTAADIVNLFEIPALRICVVNFYTVCLTQLTTVNFCVVLQAIIDSLWKMSKHEKETIAVALEA
jgi:hypothetical protein